MSFRWWRGCPRTDFPTRGGTVRVLPIPVSLVALLGACDMGTPNLWASELGVGPEGCCGPLFRRRQDLAEMSATQFHGPSGEDSISTWHFLLSCYCYIFFLIFTKVVIATMLVVSFKKFNQARSKVRESLELCDCQQLTQSPGLLLCKADRVTEKAWRLGGEKRQPHQLLQKGERRCLWEERGKD